MSVNSTPRPRFVHHFVSYGALLLCFFIWSGVAQAAEQSLKILTIGNSFADSVFRDLEGIAHSTPECEIMLGRANLGGCSLERHWDVTQRSKLQTL